MARSVLGRDPFTRPDRPEEPKSDSPPKTKPSSSADGRRGRRTPQQAGAKRQAAAAGKRRGRHRPKATQPSTDSQPPAASRATTDAPASDGGSLPSAVPLSLGKEERDVDRAELVAGESQSWSAGNDPWWRYTRFFRPSYYGRQLGRLHLSLHAEQVDPFGYDPRFQQVMQPVLEFLFERYWRVELAGLEHVPASGRLMLVANHAGSLPWDGLMIKFALEQRHPARRSTRFLVEDFIHHLPFLGAWLNRLGAVRASQDNARRLLQQEQALVVFPEGIKGLGKLYKDRYRLQRFGRGGFVKLALHTGTPLVPVAVLGSEETHPLVTRLEWPARQLGLPYLPVTPTFPWLGPLGLLPLPARWKLVFGKPVEIELDPEGAEKPQLVMELVERVREAIQRMLEDELERREGMTPGDSPQD